jgi:nucleoside-diphosphate-sugar epimerase
VARHPNQGSSDPGSLRRRRRRKNSNLVTDGAGYIGGHTILALLDKGIGPIVLDPSARLGSLIPETVALAVGDFGDQTKNWADIIREKQETRFEIGDADQPSTEEPGAVRTQ